MRNRTLFPILASALSGVCQIAAANPEPTATTAATTLQVREERGYSAAELMRLLLDPAYLASVDTRLFPAGGEGGEGRVEVVARNPGIEILTLQCVGRDESGVRAATEVLIDHLMGIVPIGRELAEEELERARERLARAEALFEELEREREEFVLHHGDVDPAATLEVLREQLKQRRVELEQTRASMAKDAAVRDYLVAALQGAALDDTERGELERELEALRAEFERLSKSRTAVHPEVREVRARIEDLSARLENAAVGGDDAGRLEADLFAVERDLQIARNRERHLVQTVSDLEERVRELSRIATEWQRLTGKSEDAWRQLQKARDRADDARDRLDAYGSGPWLRIMAGPTYRESSS